MSGRSLEVFDVSLIALSELKSAPRELFAAIKDRTPVTFGRGYCFGIIRFQQLHDPLLNLLQPAKIRIWAVLEEEVRQIIATSVKNNREADITELLFVHAGWFVQALEGRTDRVMATYQRI